MDATSSLWTLMRLTMALSRPVIVAPPPTFAARTAAAKRRTGLIKGFRAVLTALISDWNVARRAGVKSVTVTETVAPMFSTMSITTRIEAVSVTICWLVRPMAWKTTPPAAPVVTLTILVVELAKPWAMTS